MKIRHALLDVAGRVLAQRVAHAALPFFKAQQRCRRCADRQRFVETLGEACSKTGWQVHAYVLMPNHFHLVVETRSRIWSWA